MVWLWLLAGSGWVLALAAWMVVRRLARRVTVLSEQYWELKYEHGELKARVRGIAPTPEEIEASRAPVQQSFVPLANIKRPS